MGSFNQPSILAALLLAFASQAAYSDNYPSQPVKMVVPFAAGGPADVVARVLAQNSRIGQPVIVENKSGAGGTVGALQVAKAPPDGYMALFVTAGHAGSKALYPQLTFDPENDFAPVIATVRAPIVIAVNAKSKYQTFKDLVEDARQNPGKLNCAGGAGGATITNLAFEAIKRELKINITPVPYRGSAPAMTALLSGEIDCASDNVSAVLPHIRAGTVRALALTTKERFAQLPEVPTISETVLPGFEAAAWFGVLVPRATPAPVIATLHKDFMATLQKPEVKERMNQMGMETYAGTPAQFGSYVASESKRWGALIREMNLKPE